MLISDALSSDEPERVRLPGDAWYPGAAWAALSPPSHTRYVKVGRPGKGGLGWRSLRNFGGSRKLATIL